MSRGQSQRRMDFRKRTLQRCRAKGKEYEVIDIDIDSNSSNFIIIDAVDPEQPSEWNGCDASTSGKDNIIWIEDDDDVSDDYGSARENFEGRKQNFQFTTDNISQPSDNRGKKLLSESAKSSWIFSSCNNQNFSSCAFTESDDSDCCLEEDFMGTIRQQWEEASLKKKTLENATKGQSIFQDEVGPSRCYFGSPIYVYADDATEAQPTSTYTHYENETAPKASANSQLGVELNPLSHSSNGSIIGEREMLKQTDSYKRAQEEEWAARQRVLQLQAEEAKRMRKRRKAEAQRLLETERRQKQRVEEVREAQRKDEETLNIKDQFRSEVRRELDQLEVNCRDMASLLRRLGIEVEGGFYPSSAEVRTAYKQALLKFHPDRASRNDIRQQIEAEEKFKLISRAKEKFML